VNPNGGGWIIFLSLVVALILSVLHLPESWPAWLGWLRPQWLILVLFFWVIEVPQRIGLIAAWSFGLLVDVLYADPLGLNGFILAAVTYTGWRFFERLRMYSVLQQAGILFLLIFAAQLLRVFVLGFSSEREWGWNIVVTPLISVAVWPLIFLFLLRIRTGARIE
jgi:rod shape-determining protein MreD